MWVFNVTREVIRSSGAVVVPEEAPLNEVTRVEQAYKTALQAGEVYCAKVHIPINPGLPDTKIIFSYRDVRDALLSYMRFTHSDFDHSLKMAVSMMKVTDFYFQRHHKDILRIRFDDITHAPGKTINQIAEFLQHTLTAEACQEIANRYSREKVNKVLARIGGVKVTALGELEEHGLNENYTVVGNFDGTHRVVDKKTRFQANHITSSKPEEWREALSSEQREQVMKLAREWLLRYGFPL